MPDTLTITGVTLSLITEIKPDCDSAGSIKEFMPQSRYKNARRDALNPNGHGPFCRFSLRNLPPESGVYAVTVGDALVYFGECVSLASRWGLGGYGSIQPKNCYVGGQSTNCKINHRVLLAAREGEEVKLWFHSTNEHKELESVVLRSVAPPWNGRSAA